MNLQALHEEVFCELKRAGWHETRSFDSTNWRESLTNEGYKDFPYVWEVLDELGELDIHPEHKDHGHGFPGRAVFDALDVGLGEHDRLDNVIKLTGENVFPIGTVYSVWVIFVGESKRIYVASYGAKGTRVVLIGEGIESFLNHLLLNNGECVELNSSNN